MKKLLIVDDQILYLKSLELALKKRFEIKTAQNYANAIQGLEQDINIALIDIRLDENDEKNSDGLKILEWIKMNKPDIACFVMSAYREFSYAEQHQLALAMVLMKSPKLLILDEPSAGLSPGNVRNLYKILNNLKKNLTISVLLIEQNVKMAVDFSDELLLLRDGLIEKQAMSLENIEEKYFE